MTRATGSAAISRDDLVLQYMGFVRALARRYADRGEPLDDVIQVGMVGLINAADRFDPSRGIDFRSFAAPTVLGEIRRHFRDRAWGIRVPRRVKDDRVAINALLDGMVATGGRNPTVAEIACASGLGVDRVLDALAANSAYRPDSISHAPWGDEAEHRRDIPSEETGYAEADDRIALEAVLDLLPERERTILRLRFEQGMLQSEIAVAVGISQMHVSRLIARALACLREELDAAP